MSTTEKEKHLKRIIKSMDRLREEQGCYDVKLATARAKLITLQDEWKHKGRIREQDVSTREKAIEAL